MFGNGHNRRPAAAAAALPSARAGGWFARAPLARAETGEAGEKTSAGSELTGLSGKKVALFFGGLFAATSAWAAAYAVIEPPGTMLMAERALQGETIRRRPVPLERMSPHIVRAVIAAEDAKFCSHIGFDLDAIRYALRSNANGGVKRGGSTISQQTAKNVFLWRQRTWVRKGLETYFTGLIEAMWPKERIMEAYLNSIEWGDGLFGVEAASQGLFGVSAAELTRARAARLAAVLPNPNEWSADNPGPYVRRRAATIEARAELVRQQGLAGCVLPGDGA